MEDEFLEEVMDENGEIAADPASATAVSAHAATDEAIDTKSSQDKSNHDRGSGETTNDDILTLSGEVVDDEFLAGTINYNFLVDKIDALLEKLKLDA